jgi:hypothetical protein
MGSKYEFVICTEYNKCSQFSRPAVLLQSPKQTRPVKRPALFALLLETQ